MDSYDTFRFILHLLFIILIVLGSLLILLVIYVTKQYQSPSGLLIGNLALTDLLVGAFLLPFGIPTIYSEGWPSGRALCVLNGFTNQCLSCVAILTLAAISLDRYVAIIHAIRYRQLMTLKRVWMIVIALWAFGVVLAILPLLGWGQYVYEHGASLCVTDFKINKSFTFFIFIVVFGIPVNVIFIIYFRIFKAVRKQVKSIRTNRIYPSNQPGVQLNENNEINVRSTNQSAAQWTNENTVNLTNHSRVQLTNESVVQPTNHMPNQLTNEKTNYLINQSGVQSTNDVSAFEEKICSTNQNIDEITFNKDSVHTTKENPPKLDILPNHQREALATSLNPAANTSSANQNIAFSPHPIIPTNQNKAHENKTTLPKGKRRKLGKEFKAALTMFAIIGVFMISLTPFAVYSLYCLHTGESYEIADFITSKAAYSNAIFNPLIYGVMNKIFRNGFYQVFYILFRCKKRAIDFEGSTRSSFAK